MVKILVDGAWTEGTPIAGQEYRKYDAGGGFVQSFWHESLPQPDLKNSISRREFWQRVGDSVYAKLLGLAEADNLLKARIDIINADQNVWLLSPEYTSWFAELVESEVITQGEYNLIFEVKNV